MRGPFTYVTSMARLAVLGVALQLNPVIASAQRLDPSLLLEWELVPILAPAPSGRGASTVVASERLVLMRDGRLRYDRRDTRDPSRTRSGATQLSASDVRDLSAALQGLCALRQTPLQRAAGNVHVQVQFADLRSCELAFSPSAWRARSARRYAALVDRIIARALRAGTGRGAASRPAAPR